MGDIVHLPTGEVVLQSDILAAAPIERVEVFNGKELIETIRPYDQADLGRRIRVLWEGAEYRGRFREVTWDGTARFTGDRIEAATPINFLNPDKTLDPVGADGLKWRALTTGNVGGFDAVLADGKAGRLELSTPLIKVELPLAEIGLEDHVYEANGLLPRFIKVFRLPDAPPERRLRFELPVTLRAAGDNPLFLRLTQADGTRAWTSPIYVFR